jgi:hypothetical protein
MVGFGSSLRLARRPGWEGAYLDYEALKLLLSHIEAVYEEEGHENNSSGGHHFSRPNRRHRTRNGGLSSQASKHRSDIHQRNGKIRKFQEKLFLESDSEAAYLSLNDEIDRNERGFSSYLADDSPVEQNTYGILAHNAAVTTTTSVPHSATKPFSLVYSLERPVNSSPSSEEDTDPPNSTSKTCWGGTGYTGSTTTSNRHQNKKNGRNTRGQRPPRDTRQPRPGDDDFYLNSAHGGGHAAPTTFYMTGTAFDFDSDPTGRPEPTSFLSDGAGFPGLSHQETNSSFFGGDRLGGSLSPPSLTPYPRHHHHVPQAGSRTAAAATRTDMFASPTSYPVPQQQQFQPPLVTPNQAKKPVTKARRWQCHAQTRRRRRHRTVPRHLSIAHAKARAIVERFLGLVRAETEKVLLFAQSRLGELADTAGSLRFPSYDEEYASSNQQGGSGLDGKRNLSGWYEFGDGGRHPSASSSSEENGGEGWTDSSDEDEEHSHAVATNNAKVNANFRGLVVAGAAQNHGLERKDTGLSAGPSSSAAVPTPPPKTLSKSGSGGGLSDDTPTNVTARTKDMASRQYMRRQIAHFTALRQNRAVFSRHEQILGEDMLFLSAVEEADGYTAVGVELLHVLKYVAVNLIAVRKICRKHDRLLMNRMLGGYYQRVQQSRVIEKGGSNPLSHSWAPRPVRKVPTLGGLLARASGDIYEAHPSLIGQMNHYKLVGIYDKKIQKLANSRTVQVVSSCLALSLSEYEVARSRADALTMLNAGGSSSVDQATLRAQPNRSQPGPVDADDDEDSMEDPPSTASTISLTRLRYTVMSIFALREIARSKIEYFMTYLSRSMLAFTGIPVVGEGLDGCSRESLDFLVSYDPDAALLRDSSLLYDGLRTNQWSRLPLADVMVSTLAVGTTPADVPADVASDMLPQETNKVACAVSASPESKLFPWRGPFSCRLARHRNFVAVKKKSPIALFVNRTSYLLYMVSECVTWRATS